MAMATSDIITAGLGLLPGGGTASSIYTGVSSLFGGDGSPENTSCSNALSAAQIMRLLQVPRDRTAPIAAVWQRHQASRGEFYSYAARDPAFVGYWLGGQRDCKASAEVMQAAVLAKQLISTTIAGPGFNPPPNPQTPIAVTGGVDYSNGEVTGGAAFQYGQPQGQFSATTLMVVAVIMIVGTFAILRRGR